VLRWSSMSANALDSEAETECGFCGNGDTMVPFPPLLKCNESSGGNEVMGVSIGINEDTEGDRTASVDKEECLLVSDRRARNLARFGVRGDATEKADDITGGDCTFFDGNSSSNTGSDSVCVDRLPLSI
jgi:hypothetical protein